MSETIDTNEISDEKVGLVEDKKVKPEPMLDQASWASESSIEINRDPDDIFDDARVIVNIGPTHPAMHGALRMMAKLNGEIIEKSYCSFGYTHRAKEKLGENRTYHQWIVYTDRINYCSALMNNVTYAMSIERLMGVEVPPRGIWIRMMVAEIARIIDHLVCIGINAVDIGAFSYFLYGFHQREEAYTLVEKLCGARLTTSYSRIGGLMHDAPEGWEKEVKEWAMKTREVIDEMDNLLKNNRIWYKRTVGVSVFGKEDCLQYSFTGPNARAAGIDIDLRRDQPSMFYKDVEFDVPISQDGDVNARFSVRVEEIRQSLNILIQCSERIKKGPIWSEDKRTRIPDKEVVYNTMEGMIHHFKFFMEGFDVPAGEAYTPFEAANGEMGFYVVSKGGPYAHRMRIRGPSVWHYQALSPMSEGAYIADMLAGLGSINVIAGELDR
jgi:NADH dehydrogenase I D subunit